MSLQTTGTGLHSLPGKQSQENHTHTCNLSPQNQLDLHVDVAMSFQKALPGPPKPREPPKPVPSLSLPTSLWLRPLRRPQIRGAQSSCSSTFRAAWRLKAWISAPWPSPLQA